MAGLTSANFDAPDETRTPEKTKVDVVHLGSVTAARMTFQPGWKWSECVKPVAGTETCQMRHVGVLVAGGLHIVPQSGDEADIAPGDAYVIEPGHDAWVTSSEPAVGYEFESQSAETYAAGS